MRINVEKELQKERNLSVTEAEKSENIEGIKLLLENTANDERKILRDAGLDHNIKQIEKEVGINLERKKFEEKIEGTLFTEEEIENLCLKYNLRFLRSNKYNGHIEPILGSKILNFFKSKNIDSKSYEAENNLYILAPAKAFNLERLPKPPRKTDPAIFYRMTTNEGNMYALIHRWGNDFTVFRRFSGIVNMNELNYNIFHGGLKLAFLLVFFSIWFNPAHIVTFSLCLLAAIGLQFASWGTMRESLGSTKHELQFTENNWNSDKY